MSSFCIRDRRVLGFRPSNAAAPSAPSSFHPADSSTSMMCRRSTSSRERAVVGPGEPGTSKGACSGSRSVGPSETRTACSMRFCSSRTFPGHSRACSASITERGTSSAGSGQALARALDEGQRQGGDVLFPLAQRGDGDREHVEAVLEVLAEPARRHLLGEVAVGRGDDPHVDLIVRSSADPLELPVLEHAQELGLELRRQLADLVEEERACRRPARSGPSAAPARR